MLNGNKVAVNPGSNRRYDMSDGLYIGGVLNGTPSQFVEFSSSGITVTSPSKVTINAPSVVMNTTELQVSGDIIDNFSSNSHTVAQMRSIYDSHVHGGVQPGSGNTGGPSVTE